MEDFVVIGKIKGVHGNKGVVKVLPLTDFPRRFDGLKQVFLAHGEKETSTAYDVERVTYLKKFVGLKLANVDSVPKAWELNNLLVVLPLAERIPLETDSYYISDLIGLKVVDSDDTFFGTLTNVIKTGADNAVLVIENKGKELLLPALKETVKQVDLKQGVITVNLGGYADGN